MKSSTGAEKKWRDDGRCGSLNQLPDGTPAQCNPDGNTPCCDYRSQMCANATNNSCTCSPGCIDYREKKTLTEGKGECIEP